MCFLHLLRVFCRRGDGGAEAGQPAGGADGVEGVQSAVLGPQILDRPRPGNLSLVSRPLHAFTQ